ncbi:unnamed protein product [Ostreobium quekettii]|uniref:Intraflagellar transport protein 46 homolog n=1 Tax=Ostreobium quekettii TaxID=121088 RepID=A0A8S1JDQ2_9CHLO|nr:unnamed protein product [Ostreobium quekettii]|eukprot:evm.model.scf_21EXC.6 EVM.evm.TU.scf_21EXC.6   scf_21EXC:71883-74468(+)
MGQAFQVVSCRYKPPSTDLDTKLKPFIPDFIPAIGDIDEFIKVPRPDGRPDYLGLKVLDEPGAHQSNPTILSLKLRQIIKKPGGRDQKEVVGLVAHGEEGRIKKINGWIESIREIRSKNAPPVVTYPEAMPDVEALMQEWSPEVAETLQDMRLPTKDLDVDLMTFVKIVCTVLDIPVRSDPLPSLHILFLLFLEFKNHPYLAGHQLAGSAEAPGRPVASAGAMEGPMVPSPGLMDIR